jgi:hypothetical protein
MYPKCCDKTKTYVWNNRLFQLHIKYGEYEEIITYFGLLLKITWVVSVHAQYKVDPYEIVPKIVLKMKWGRTCYYILDKFLINHEILLSMATARGASTLSREEVWTFSRYLGTTRWYYKHIFQVAAEQTPYVWCTHICKIHTTYYVLIKRAIRCIC